MDIKKQAAHNLKTSHNFHQSKTSTYVYLHPIPLVHRNTCTFSMSCNDSPTHLNRNLTANGGNQEQEDTLENLFTTIPNHQRPHVPFLPSPSASGAANGRLPIQQHRENLKDIIDEVLDLVDCDDFMDDLLPSTTYPSERSTPTRSQ